MFDLVSKEKFKNKCVYKSDESETNLPLWEIMYDGPTNVLPKKQTDRQQGS